MLTKINFVFFLLKECDDMSAQLAGLETPTSELDEEELIREAEKAQQEIEQTKVTFLASNWTLKFIKLAIFQLTCNNCTVVLYLEESFL